MQTPTRSRTAFLVAALTLSLSAPIFAGIDNAKTRPGEGGPDGMCDVWQAIYNAWESTGFTPSADMDNDGCSNLVESLAGTDPRNPADCHQVGNMVISANTIVFTFDAEAGKRYRVLSDDAPAGLFATVVTQTAPVNGASQFIPAADIANQTLSVTKAPDSRKFYRLEVADVDSDSDGVSDWAEIEGGFLPNDPDGDSDNDGVSDLVEVTQEVSVPDVVTIEATTPLASEDGPQSGCLTVRRTRSLFGATVNYGLGGTATPTGDFAHAPTPGSTSSPTSGSVTFAAGVREACIFVNPNPEDPTDVLEGSESVTATLTTATNAGGYVAPTIDPAKDEATVIIGNTTVVGGTGLLARYYDHSNGLYTHAANFGDSANYQYTRNGNAGNNYAGSVAVITPTGVSSTRLSTLLAALTPSTTQVKFSFNGGNLNTAVYNHQNFLVTAKTAATFTIALPPGAGLPTNSTSTCFFSIQPLHPALVERVDPVVNNDWIYGTPNAVTISHLNSPDNYSETFETYLAPSTAGSYRFQLDADDKARVLIDLNLNGVFDLPGEQIVEHGWDTTDTVSPEDGTADNEVVGTFKATPSGSPYVLAIPGSPAQRYKMRVEHVDATGDARCRLQWSVNGGAFANIPQANQFTHTQAMTWSYAAGNLVVTPTGGHSRAVSENVDLSFSSGPLFRPGATSTHNGTLQISAVNGTTTFTVAIPPSSTVTVPGATTLAGSATVTVPSVAGLIPGMSVSGTGIPAGAYIITVGTTTITLATGTGVTAQASTTLTCRQGGLPISVAGVSTTAGSQTVLVPSVDGLAVGMYVTGVGLPTNATISAINPGAILLSTATGITTQASTTMTAFLHPTNTVTGNGFVLNNSASTINGVYNLIYNNTTFAGSPGRVGVDSTGPTAANNGIWGRGTPDPAIQPDTFSARWSGQVQPQFSEEYTFIVHADDGSSLWINGQLQEMKTVPSTSTGGATYSYDSSTGNMVVTYTNMVIKPDSFTVGEPVRVDPTSGNLTHGNGSTYTYDGVLGILTVDYSNLANITAGGFTVGETIELDPTSGSLTTLATLPYVITSEPTTSTFTVSVQPGIFDSQPLVTLPGAATTAGSNTVTVPSITGLTVGMRVTGTGLPANEFITGFPSATTITITTGTGVTTEASTALTFTSTINILDTRNAIVTAVTPNTFTFNVGSGKYTTGTGNINVEIVNQPLKEWSAMGNERYFRIPMVGGTRYDIQLDSYEGTGYSRCQLYWQSPSQPKQIIPQDRLYPASVPQAPPAHISPTDATTLAGSLFSYPVGGSNGGSVSVSGNPAWLTYSGGVLSGTPPPGSAGDYQVVITVTNGTGTSTSVLNLHVEEAGGSIVRELWSGVSGTTVASLNAAIASGTTTPTMSNLTSLAGPTGAGPDYGARIRGYITAPVTGNYYFWIAANNGAELWISNDDEPVNSYKRAWVTTGNATPQTWDGEVNQKSPWLALEAGKRYYIEVLHKAGSGTGDNLAVGWLKPGQSGTVPSEVVPGYALSPYVAPPPGSTPGTLYVATMLAQGGAVTNGVGLATFRLSEDENVATISFDIPGFLAPPYNGLTGPMTDWHVHNDPYLGHSASIMYDPNVVHPPGDGPQPDGTHKWTIPSLVGTKSKADVIALIKQGKAYINIHTTAYLNGEIRGNFTLAAGSRTFSPPPAMPAWTDDSDTNNGASRFLAQASFGASTGDITALKALSATAPVPAMSGVPASRYNAWIDDQFTKPASNLLAEVYRTENASAQGGAFNNNLTFNAWWWRSITGSDQLRQRVAFALSQIHVVSAQGPLDNNAVAVSYFYDKLLNNAFGNFRTILEDTTLTPSMGRYLDMLRNDKPDPSVGRIPNENYAREIKQLFSVGLYRMWPDGTLILNSQDNPIDVYTQREIVGFAHVFTGWDYHYNGAYRTTLSAAANWDSQMREVPARHYTGPKRVLNNEVLPGLTSQGGQPLDPIATHTLNNINDPAYEALPGQELDITHDQLFNHPNTGPFICRQLIQRLVTSAPSRDYVYRVVQKFNDNGSGVRGDMKAVIKAILLDFEARKDTEATKPAFGKQREPVLRVAAAARAFRTTPWTGTYTQSGTRTITVNVTAGGPHGLESGDTLFLDFTSGSPAPWIGTYGAGTPLTATSFTVQAAGWNNGTYAQIAGSNVMTVTMGSHWLQTGHQTYIDFTSGASPADGIYTVASSATTDQPNAVNSGTFTITMPDTTARSGNLMIPRFTPGSYTTSASGLPAPNDRRVTMDTNFNHELTVGQQVQINFYDGNPLPVDRVATVESVVDLNTWTFLAPSAGGTNLSPNQGNNSVYQFPLQPLPMTRNGNVGNRASTFQVNSTTTELEQTPINSPTVFNFFLPDYKFPGTLQSQGITTPEFQLTAETTVVRQANYLYNGLFGSNNVNGINSFNNGNHALVMDFFPWYGNAVSTAGSVGAVLGAGPQTGQAWTSNANLSTLVDRLNTLLVGETMPTAAKNIVLKFLDLRAITAISAQNPCRITSAGHNLNTGDVVTISGVTGGTFTSGLGAINTTLTITKIDNNVFSVPVACTAAPNAGQLSAAVAPIVPYNNTTPSDTNKRDRLRAILHFILTGPDFTIQR